MGGRRQHTETAATAEPGTHRIADRVQGPIREIDLAATRSCERKLHGSPYKLQPVRLTGETHRENEHEDLRAPVDGRAQQVLFQPSPTHQHTLIGHTSTP